MLIVEAIVLATGVGTIVGPAVGMLTSGKRKLRELQKQLDEALTTIKGLDTLMIQDRDVYYQMGRKHLLEEIERNHREGGGSYREAAQKAAKVCASCNRTCPHCARLDPSGDTVRHRDGRAQR